MLIYHLEALKRSKITPQFVLTKGFKIVQCCERQIGEYLANGYRISARYANGFGQTFYRIESPESMRALSEIAAKKISGENVFVEMHETFGSQLKTEQKVATVYICDDKDVVDTYKIETPDVVERFDAALYNLRNCGVQAIPNISLRECDNV